MPWHRRLLIAGTALLAACGDSTGPREPRLELDRTIVYLYEGTETQVAASYYDERGQRVGGSPNAPVVQWVSSNPSVATVDLDGRIHAVEAGHAVVTAVAGSASATVDVVVREDEVQPTVATLAVSPSPVDLAPGDAQLSVALQLRDPETGVRDVFVGVADPAGSSEDLTCRPPAPEGGTIFDGRWACTFPFSRYMPPGRWTVYAVVTDHSGNMTYRATGVDVAGAWPDTEPPAITGLAIVPDSVDVRTQAAVVEVRVGVSDAHSGFRRLEVTFRRPDGALVPCSTPGSDLPNDRRQLTVACGVMIPRLSSIGTWSVATVRVTDMRGNVATDTEAQLQAMGLKTTFKVTA